MEGSKNKEEEVSAFVYSESEKNLLGLRGLFGFGKIQLPSGLFESSNNQEVILELLS